MEGYNISLKLNEKTLLGRTQDDLTIAAVVKESLTKDDKGSKNKKVTGHDVTFKLSGVVDVTKPMEVQKLSRDEVIELSLKTGDEAVVPFKYIVEGGKGFQGNAIITGYNESSSAEGDATYGLDLAVTGAMTPIVELP